MRLGRIAALAHKEWREIVRDRIFFFLAFLLPPVLMLVFGYGLTQDVEQVPLAVLDQDLTPASRDYARQFTGSRYFAFRRALETAGEADRLLADGAVRVVLLIPPGFAERLLDGRPAEVQVLLDGTFTNSVRTVRAYVEAINGAAVEALRRQALVGQLGVAPPRAEVRLRPVRLEVRYLYNEAVRSIWSVAPSLVMFVLTLIVPLLMALNVVREKESGAIYNVYASTLTRAEFLAGKLVPVVAVATIDALVLWTLAVWYFGVPFKGGALFFAGATVLYILCAACAGLLISLLVRTQQAALAICVILTMIVAITYSGWITPLSSLTGLTWVIAQALPPSHYNTVVKGAFLKGAGAATLWPETAVFVAHTAVLLAAAWWLFRKRTPA